MRIFLDRREAGRELGERLRRLGLGRNVVVMALATRGIPVAEEVAKVLAAPMDVMVVRKLRAPSRSARAVGAVAHGGVTVYDEQSLAEHHLTREDIEPQRTRELAELARQEGDQRCRKPFLGIAGKTVVLVDDGIETGTTMYAAVLALRALAPSRVIGAVPTGARDPVTRLEDVADRMVALDTPQPYRGIDASYATPPQSAKRNVLPFVNRGAQPAARESLQSRAAL